VNTTSRAGSITRVADNPKKQNRRFVTSNGWTRIVVVNWQNITNPKLMELKEFKARLEELLTEASETPMNHGQHLHMIGILEYYCFAFKLGHAKACEKHNTEQAEGGELEFGE
jgi:hypothetical protein